MAVESGNHPKTPRLTASCNEVNKIKQSFDEVPVWSVAYVMCNVYLL